MTTACLSPSNSYALPVRRGILRRIPVMAWNIAVITVIAGLGMGYLAQINHSLAANYQINEVQKQVEAANGLARSNEIKLSEYSTVNNITTQAAAIGMVPTSGVEYVTVSHPGVAMR